MRYITSCYFFKAVLKVKCSHPSAGYNSMNIYMFAESFSSQGTALAGSAKIRSVQ